MDHETWSACETCNLPPPSRTPTAQGQESVYFSETMQISGLRFASAPKPSTSPMTTHVGQYRRVGEREGHDTAFCFVPIPWLSFPNLIKIVDTQSRQRNSSGGGGGGVFLDGRIYRTPAKQIGKCAYLEMPAVSFSLGRRARTVLGTVRPRGRRLPPPISGCGGHQHLLGGLCAACTQTAPSAL